MLYTCCVMCCVTLSVHCTCMLGSLLASLFACFDEIECACAWHQIVVRVPPSHNYIMMAPSLTLQLSLSFLVFGSFYSSLRFLAFGSSTDCLLYGFLAFRSSFLAAEISSRAAEVFSHTAEISSSAAELSRNLPPVQQSSFFPCNRVVSSRAAE